MTDKAKVQVALYSMYGHIYRFGAAADYRRRDHRGLSLRLVDDGGR